MSQAQFLKKQKRHTNLAYRPFLLPSSVLIAFNTSPCDSVLKKVHTNQNGATKLGSRQRGVPSSSDKRPLEWHAQNLPQGGWEHISRGIPAVGNLVGNIQENALESAQTCVEICQLMTVFWNTKDKNVQQAEGNGEGNDGLSSIQASVIRRRRPYLKPGTLAGVQNPGNSVMPTGGYFSLSSYCISAAFVLASASILPRSYLSTIAVPGRLAETPRHHGRNQFAAFLQRRLWFGQGDLRIWVCRMLDDPAAVLNIDLVQLVESLQGGGLKAHACYWQAVH
ncbi:hypothetical protein BKA70DRAFT_1241348 [Coprinopsis sp. MPI-PUGE-AT-0042]|nr:hypothetical protein BKA70DRAFT_1241348 [Coprinopsis sp. MPI-PUGE-AT-0042]